MLMVPSPSVNLEARRPHKCARSTNAREDFGYIVRAARSLFPNFSSMLSITFAGIDTTLFNFASDVVSVVGRTLLGLSLSYLYALLMSWQVKAGKPIPIRDVGNVPDGFFSAARLVQSLHWSTPAVVLALLFMAADFSHSIADLGLKFVLVQTEGPSETILDLSQRNPLRPFQTAGDPFSYRTRHLPVSAFEFEYATSRPQRALLTSYLDAVDLIARGGSPLVDDRSVNQTRADADWGGITNIADVRYQTDDGFLVRMNLELPLNCSSSEMVKIEQRSLGTPQVANITDFDQVFDVSLIVEDFFSEARVPNCSFRALRSTGISGEIPGAISVHETVEILFVYFDYQVFLTQGGDLFTNFTMTPDEKRLARDREDWRQGRSVTDIIDGIKIGNIDIRFGAVVTATGTEGAPLGFTIFSDRIEYERSTNYGLVAEILGECPPRPSGLPATDKSCFAIMTMRCQAFEEDYELYPSLDQRASDSVCYLEQVNVIWGEGFQADAEIVAIVAGIYGRVRPHNFDGNAEANFVTNAIFAAMFAVASLDTRPSVVEKISPKVNAVYIICMLLPFVLAAATWMVVRAKRGVCLPIPQNPWELMVLGKEEEEIPRRENKKSRYPMRNEGLALALVKDETSKGSQLSIVTDMRLSSRIQQSNSGNTDSQEEAAVTSTSPENSCTHEEATSTPYDPFESVPAAAPSFQESRDDTTGDPSGIYQLDGMAYL